MAQTENKKSILPQIIVAVVVTLLVGGTAPWWWNEFFHKNNDVKPPPIQGKQIQVQCTANPHSIPAGGQVQISVFAFTEQSYPVNNASVQIVAGGGWFAKSGTTTEVGQTDANGVFITQWQAPNPAATNYGMSVKVNKTGLAKGTGELKVSIK